jgi:hypothetical protein
MMLLLLELQLALAYMLEQLAVCMWMLLAVYTEPQLGRVGFRGQAAAGLQQPQGHNGPKTGELGHERNRTGQGCCEVLERNRISERGQLWG